VSGLHLLSGNKKVYLGNERQICVELVLECKALLSNVVKLVDSRKQSWFGGVIQGVTLTHQILSTCAQNCLIAVLELGSILVVAVVFITAVIFAINNDPFMHQVKHY
jgi:hypothetical protein